jgi:hypothetical protein
MYIVVTILFAVAFLTVSVCKPEFGTLDRSPRSRTAKPNSDHEKNAKASINRPIYRREEVVSLLWTWRRGGLIRISTINMLAA